MKIGLYVSTCTPSVGLFTMVSNDPGQEVDPVNRRAYSYVTYRFTTVIALVFFAIEIELYNKRYADMSEQQQQPVPGPLVEDETRVGGIDENGAAVIGNKTPTGQADESVKPTDERESAQNS